MKQIAKKNHRGCPRQFNHRWSRGSFAARYRERFGWDANGIAAKAMLKSVCKRVCRLSA
jgi:hypothetical protein